MPERAYELKLAEDIGAIRAQLKELIHDGINRVQRDESVSRSLTKLGELPKQMDKLEKSVAGSFKDIDKRLKTLEDDKVARHATHGVFMAILKSPALGWFFGAVATVWAFLTLRTS